MGSPFSVLLPFFPLRLGYVSTATLLLGKLATLLLLQCDLYLHFSTCAIMTKCRKQLTFSMNFLYTERDKSMTTRNLRYLTTKILIAKKISPPSPIHCYYLKWNEGKFYCQPPNVLIEKLRGCHKANQQIVIAFIAPISTLKLRHWPCRDSSFMWKYLKKQSLEFGGQCRTGLRK